MAEIRTPKELYEQGEIDEQEYNSDKFKDKAVIRFNLLEEAMEWGRKFMSEYLIPKYGRKGAMSFGMRKTEPYKSSIDIINEALGAKKPSLEETWVLIPSDKSNEVQEYLDKKQ